MSDMRADWPLSRCLSGLLWLWDFIAVNFDFHIQNNILACRVGLISLDIWILNWGPYGKISNLRCSRDETHHTPGMY